MDVNKCKTCDRNITIPISEYTSLLDLKCRVSILFEFAANNNYISTTDVKTVFPDFIKHIKEGAPDDVA